MKDDQRKAAVIANDLDSMIHRIEDLPAHPAYTQALMRVQEARDAIYEGKNALHQQSMRERFSR